MPLPRAELEKRSAAVTLSDMEMFIFPELIYSLVLANIMSPVIWRWRDDPWFEGIGKLKPYRRILRIKQFIMDKFSFNLDLNTWGLTTKNREIERFRDFIDPDTLRQSNALFGYEGDRYYFDIDIRAHFGLDQYDGDVIPYWKTETVEAMQAFRYREGYATGAGECVSLATLYAAALFIIGRIPLKDIYLMATPLHSQNFVDIGDGILTNNRRLVTKNMWFNGTALSAQARRALENERITIVAHESGIIQTIYADASIDRAAYNHFRQRLKNYLKTQITPDILINFLRHNRDKQQCFQLRWPVNGSDHYIAVERLFAYEHCCTFQLNKNMRSRLMAEVETEEFRPAPLAERLVLNDIEDYMRTHRIDPRKPKDMQRFKEHFATACIDIETAARDLFSFARTEPRFPDADSKKFQTYAEPLKITADMDRPAIIKRLEAIRDQNPLADLAFHAYRDLSRNDPAAFLKAAIERNPVCIEGTKSLDPDDIYNRICAMPADSIYEDDGRLAQPDEVWNYGRGDGLEKAVMLAGILHSRQDGKLVIRIEDNRVSLETGSRSFSFTTAKGLSPQIWKI